MSPVASSEPRPLLEGLAEDDDLGSSDRGVEMFGYCSTFGSELILGVDVSEEGTMATEGGSGDMKFGGGCDWRFSAIAPSADVLISGEGRL